MCGAGRALDVLRLDVQHQERNMRRWGGGGGMNYHRHR